MNYDDLMRMHESKLRLIAEGWKFTEWRIVLTYCVEAQNVRLGDSFTGTRATYDAALDDALRYASHAQARHETNQSTEESGP